MDLDKSVLATMQELEKTREEFWNITPEVGKFIHNKVLTCKYRTVIEIGTSNGYSGLWLASALKKTGGHLYTIESHKKQRFALATQSFKNSGLAPHITQILGHAPEAIPDAPKTFDLAFFDATKYEHLQFFKALEDRISIGGTIITDNINSHRDQLQDYINYIHSLPNWNSEILDLGTGLMVSERL